MPMIPLSEIQDSGENVRRIGAGAAADAGLRASIATLGVLVPVLLRPAQDGGYIVLEGRRRIAAARTLNLTEIPAEISQANPDIPDDAISAATNMVRAPMHPVDQWRVVQQLQAEHGYSVNGAAEAVRLFRAEFGDDPQAIGRQMAIKELRGKDLVCWCRLDQPCHADVLLELANAPLRCEATNGG